MEEDHVVIGSYDLLVVDDSKDPKKLSGKILCYVNYGMAEEDWGDFKKYKSILISRNEDWNREWWVDVTSDLWISRIKSEVSKAKKRGFDGIWLDNGDIYWYVLEEMKNRSKASKIYLSMVNICKWIKDQGMILILNGADTFVSALIDYKQHGVIDGVNQETVFTKIISYSGDGKFSKQDPDEQKYYTNYCKKCKSAGLKVLLLEYGSEPAELKDFKYCDGYYISKGLNL